MKLGCFALIHPFAPLDRQLAQIATWGFRYADITDNSDGASLGTAFGFAAVASLDANPHDLRRQFAAHGLEISSWCAHANLLDPSAPSCFGTAQVMKAVKQAAAIGLRHVITTEGEPSTPFGHKVAADPDRAVFAIAEKLHEPLRLAADLGVKILFEPHGPVSDSIALTERVLHECDSPALALNLDTGNLWLGGGEPLAYIEAFAPLIEHVHWKDMPAEMTESRGRRYGCGMATIPLGQGVVGIAAIVAALQAAGFTGHTTLEVAGDANVLASRDFLLGLGAG
jgi:inosose dehydratase